MEYALIYDVMADKLHPLDVIFNMYVLLVPVTFILVFTKGISLALKKNISLKIPALLMAALWLGLGFFSYRSMSDDLAGLQQAYNAKNYATVEGNLEKIPQRNGAGFWNKVGETYLDFTHGFIIFQMPHHARFEMLTAGMPVKVAVANDRVVRVEAKLALQGNPMDSPRIIEGRPVIPLLFPVLTVIIGTILLISFNKEYSNA